MSTSSKEQIQAALVKAINHVVVQHVVEEYMARTQNPTVSDLPLLVARAREILK